jgi:hypothetical protein
MKGDPTYTGISISVLRRAVRELRKFFDHPDSPEAKFNAKNAVAELHGSDPEVLTAFLKEADVPYLQVFSVSRLRTYNPDYGDNRECWCGHPYYRHFDTYKEMLAVGCKYCGCTDFRETSEPKEKEGEQDAQ